MTVSKNAIYQFSQWYIYKSIEKLNWHKLLTEIPHEQKIYINLDNQEVKVWENSEKLWKHYLHVDDAARAFHILPNFYLWLWMA